MISDVKDVTILDMKDHIFKREASVFLKCLLFLEVPFKQHTVSIRLCVPFGNTYCLPFAFSFLQNENLRQDYIRTVTAYDSQLSPHGR